MTRRVLVLAAAAALVGVGAGTAYAYFTSSGSSTGSASTGTMQTVTITATAGSPNTALLPDGTGDVVLQVDNPNDFAVTLVSVIGSGAVGVDAEHSGCDPSVVTFTNQTGLSISIPASASGYQVDLPGAAAMSSSASDACQGATFSIPVTIAVQK
jgi:predicted ribosomally synthesized peptide with SipW-like signal peptide